MPYHRYVPELRDDSMQLLSVAAATKWEIHRSDVIRDLGAGELLLKLL